MMDKPPAWHTFDVREAARQLGTSLTDGLTRHEASERIERYGLNELVEHKARTALSMFLDQFKDFMIIVLMAAAVISGVIGDPTDTLAIIVIIILNAAIGFVQEYRAEKAMEALRGMAAQEALVVRDGRRERVPAGELVPGDLVLLEAGQVVPADLRVVEAVRLKVSESALTGESVPVEKAIGPVEDEGTGIADRRCMAYKGTAVTYGRGAGFVIATGMETELGRIAKLIQEEKDTRTPLQKRLASFGRRLSIGALVICAVIFGAGLLRGEPLVLMFLTAVSLAVAAIPEALPAVVTISLALGAAKMVKKKALMRRLSAVETLGSVTYICTDKTGTLTQNRMAVSRYFVAGSILDGAPENPPENPVGPLGTLLTAMAISNDAHADRDGGVTGDPTEAALYEAAMKAGFDKARLDASRPRMAEVPFDSDRKLMSTLHEEPGGVYVMYTKGALEEVVKRSVGALGEAGDVPLDREALKVAGDEAAGEGFRVLAFGFRRMEVLPESIGPADETGLVFIGFVCLIDPPRPEAKDAVSDCHSAGIRTVMITGDHPATAAKIATDLGICDEKCGVITGPELDMLSLPEFESRVEGIRVYARVAPEQKLKIVQALKDRGQYVAMTGDGVNDAPALKRADIGVAMGITGTDVAKEASDMVLLDDNFATIVKAVREGRRIYDNIRKFIRYSMASNSGEIWTLFLAPFLGLPIPLLPIHILWINLVTDGLPGLSLAAEPEEVALMSRPPRPPEESVFAHGLGSHIIWVGLLMGSVCIAVQYWAFNTGGAHWQSMVFTVLCLSQMGHVMAIRSERESLFSQGLLSNKPLLFSVVLTFVLQMATLYLPPLNVIFKTQPLTATELGITLGLSTVVFFAVEVEKSVRRRLAKRPATA